jgi:hypothetical protein
MGNGVPVRLSNELAARARTAAELEDRSISGQVEHWARIGQAIEDVIAASTMKRLKARSHDPELHARISRAATAEGTAAAAKLIAQRDPVRYGTDRNGKIVRVGAPKPRR